MGSHFSTIGLPVASAEDMDALANQILPLAEPFAAPDGMYFRWQDPSGAEIWLQHNAKNELVGMTPHFAGGAAVCVGLTERIPIGQPGDLDGSFHAWADPEGDAPDCGCYPFIFDAPDYWLHDDLELPAQRQVQIAAFAHQIAAFESEAAFEARSEDGPGHSAQLFIPTGLYPKDGEGALPQALAFISGYVRAAGEKINALTGRPFYWAQVQTIGGAYDVVIDSEMLPRAPVPGGVVHGSFWLSGRIVG